MINKRLLITWVVSIIGAYFIGNIVPLKIFSLNVDWHKQIGAGDLYNYCVNTIQAIGTVGAVIVALFSDNIKSYFRKPELDISLHSDDLMEELDNCNGANRKAKRYHNSVDIFNRGNINAENCEVYIDSIAFKGLGMQTFTEILQNEQSLYWSGNEQRHNTYIPVQGKKSFSNIRNSSARGTRYARW